MVQKVVGSIPISHPMQRFQLRVNSWEPMRPKGQTVRSRYPTPLIIRLAGIVQGLVCKFSKLEMRVRFSLPAPFLFHKNLKKRESFVPIDSLYPHHKNEKMRACSYFFVLWGGAGRRASLYPHNF